MANVEILLSPERLCSWRLQMHKHHMVQHNIRFDVFPNLVRHPILCLTSAIRWDLWPCCEDAPNFGAQIDLRARP